MSLRLISILIVGSVVVLVTLAVRASIVEDRYIAENGCARTEETRVLMMMVGKVMVPVTQTLWTCPTGRRLWK